MKHKPIRILWINRALYGVFFLLIVASGASHAGGELDHHVIHSGKISKGTPIHIHYFSTDGADLGNPKFVDLATTMANSAPPLLAADIVHALRNAGFSAITLDTTEGGRSSDALNVTGRFTKLDPGSQNLRVWIGLGAGESKVCVSGEVSDPSGETLAEFADCRNGLGWGASGPQMTKGAEILGERIAKFLIDWAD